MHSTEWLHNLAMLTYNQIIITELNPIQDPRFGADTEYSHILGVMTNDTQRVTNDRLVTGSARCLIQYWLFNIK